MGLKTVLGLLIFLTDIYKADADCSDSILLPELPKRSRAYQADGVRGSDPYVDDRYLYPNWYSVVSNGEQWLMPDKNFKPEKKFCGTVQPIYLKETHPDVNTLTEQSLSIVACELYPFDSCENTITIEIRKCGNEVQYYLTGTSSNSAFCFDPPALQNVRDFSEPPTVKLGTLSVSPELRFKENVVEEVVYLLPFLAFVCNETGGDNKQGHTLIYTTYWYIDDKLTFTYEDDSGLSALTEENLMSENIGLGIQIRCAANLAKSNTGRKTNLTTSTNFFAGVKVDEKLVYMSKNESKKISFQTTVPYGCYAIKDQSVSGACKTKVHMVVPDPDNCELADTNLGGQNVVNYHNSHQAICGFEVEGCYPNEVPCTKTKQKASMNITTPFFSNDDPDSYRFKLVVQDAMTHKIWKGYNIDEVVVHIIDNINYKNKVCFSHVDPHMQTADGRSYENNNFDGEFILYWNTEYNTMVQEKTTLCNNDAAYCTCAVSVRAGGDIFLVNLCNELKFIGMTSCKDNGALVIQKYSEFDYQIQTNIGTLIKIRIKPHPNYEELMNIDIIMAPKDYSSIKGLCGTFDSNKANDFHDRNGNVMTKRLEFINTWRLGGNDKNYLNLTCKADVNTWEEDGQQLFCSCNCYGDKKSSCGTPETEAICSPSQYINCTVKLQKTDDLCRDFSHKCRTEKRRRRSSFTVDPEKEMQRRAALAEKRTSVRKKRQSGTQNDISMDEVKKLCTDGITKSQAVEKYSNLLGGYNYSVIIEHCIFDVYEGQDIGWLGAHEVAMNDAVQVGFKRNANYTEANKEVLVEFKRHYCPSDCNGNGNCTDEGICSCGKDHFGPDCRNSIAQAPLIEDVEGGGICDRRFGSECKCFEVQIDALSETFYCRRKIRGVYVNGSSRTNKEAEQVSGLYKNFFTGECCFESHRDKFSVTSISSVMLYEFDVSLSNDGVNFSPVVTLHVYDSLCQEFITDANGNATVQLKDGTCFIKDYCIEGNTTDIGDKCNRCIPEQDRFEWTFDCIEQEREDEDKSKLYIIIAVAGGVIVLLLCVTGVCWCVRKKKRTKRQREHVYNATSNMAYSKERGIETYGSSKDDAVEYDTLDEAGIRSNEYTNAGMPPHDRKTEMPYMSLDKKRMNPNESVYRDLQA